jgi:hypothetical protein
MALKAKVANKVQTNTLLLKLYFYVKSCHGDYPRGKVSRDGQRPLIKEYRAKSGRKYI